MLAYDEEFFFPGGMFRGYPPDESNYFTKKTEFDKLLYPFKHCELTSIELVKIGQFSENASFLVNVEYNNIRHGSFIGRKVLIKKESISTDHPTINRSLKKNGSSILNSNLNIKLEAQYNDTYKRKMLNIFTRCQKYDPSYKFSTECEINIDLTSCEQTFNLDMTDPQKNQYILKFKFSIITETLNLVKFNFKTNPFKEVIMDSCKNDYKYFGLNMIEWKQEEKGSRANHLIHVNLGNKSIALYDLEMMHVISRKWSSISLRDIQNGNLLASSHLIGVDQLPNINQLPVKYNKKILAEYPYLTDIPCLIILDDRYEKAMLVRNLRGDFAIIKGKTG
jgi:hypothetical protein